MSNLDQVISNLAILRTWAAVNPNYGMGLGVDDCKKAVGWLDEAIDMLKAQQPRVMTLEEVLDRFTTGTPWFCEVNKERSGAGDRWELPIRARNTEIDSLRVDDIRGNSYNVHSDTRHYGYVWRCWTTRPTPEQMNEVKWDG